MTLIISISGVRGIIGESLTDDVAINFAKAFATFIGKGTVILGRDPRASGEHMKDIFISALNDLGINVIYIGIVPTPTVQIMVKHFKAAGGVVITASHNPIQWNGIKFIREDGIFLNSKEANKLIHIYSTKKFKKPSPKGSVKTFNGSNDIHIDSVLKHVDVKAIIQKQFKVVLDSCNGAGSIITPLLLKKLGCEVVKMYTDTSSPFPHNPEPIPENIQDLCKKVQETNADIGFAQDADADRLALVTDKGFAAGEEYTVALAVYNILSKEPKKKQLVVTNLSTSMMSDVIAGKFKAKSLRAKVGEVNVAETMKKYKATIGGEGNGGVMYPKVGYNRDSLVAAALILDLLAKEGNKLSTIIGKMPHYEIVKTKIECKSADEAKTIIDKIKTMFKNEKMDTRDGIKILFDNAWLQIRASNTEPVIRIIAEAETKEMAQEYINKTLSFC